MKNFPTLEELNAMPEVRLRNLDVTEPEEVQLVQSIINKRFPAVLKDTFVDGSFDIRTPEEEAKIQKEIDERKLKFQARVAGTPEAEPEVEEMVVENHLPETHVLPKVKCQVCGSKISRHKPNCPELKK